MRGGYHCRERHTWKPIFDEVRKRIQLGNYRVDDPEEQNSSKYLCGGYELSKHTSYLLDAVEKISPVGINEPIIRAALDYTVGYQELDDIFELTARMKNVLESIGLSSDKCVCYDPDMDEKAPKGVNIFEELDNCERAAGTHATFGEWCAKYIKVAEMLHFGIDKKKKVVAGCFTDKQGYEILDRLMAYIEYQDFAPNGDAKVGVEKLAKSLVEEII